MPFAALVMTAFAWRVTGELPLLRVSPRVAWILLISGLLGLTVGGTLYLFSLQEIGAARTGALSAVSPVFAMILAVALLRERPGWKAILGTLVATAGVVLITMR
jgi:drug/metabolite transporter (DMT)-like permease